MRKDQTGLPCPETLGEYREWCVKLGGEETKAVRFLDEKISLQGPHGKVWVSDEKMKELLYPMLEE